MATFNIARSFGKFDAEVMLTSLKCIPIIWVIVMLLMTFIVGRIANYGVRRFTEPTDGFNTRIVFNIIFCVTMMSMSMTLIGGIIGQGIGALIGGGTVDIAETMMIWPEIWPRNFCIAFWVEMLIAQPAARKAMVMIHRSRMGDVTAS